jgi:serine/threonine-protein kinase HipA
MRLDVYLHGEKVASLYRDGEGYSLAYDPEAVERLGEERARLSYALPPREQPYGPQQCRPYVEGLLPAAARRRRIAHELGVDPDDGFALIAELGRDCPGAVVFLPEGERPEPREAGALAWLEEGELEEALEFPPERLFDPEVPQRMRFALPGERHKLALVRGEDGRWAWPEPGAPSTHVLIPESGPYPESAPHPESALNEYVCSNALRGMGLPVAFSQLVEIAGRWCLVSTRFDRWGEGAGAELLHSESFEQAMGIAPDDELGDVEGLVRGFELLHFIEEPAFRESFFSVAFCAWAMGNHDERFISNVALMHGESGLVPGLFHDISSDDVYEPEGLKFPITEVAERCSAIVATGKFGMGMMLDLQDATRLSFRHLHDLDDLLPAVSEKAASEGWGGPVIDEIHEHVSRRLGYLREEVGR